MTLRGRGPWLASVGVHGALAVLAVYLLGTPAPPAPGVLRMHLSAPAASSASASRPSPSSSWMPPAVSTPAAASEPNRPGWLEAGHSNPSTPAAAPVPVSLEELLGALETSTEAPKVKAASPGWTGPGGLGYTAPPLPPPSVTPPQGAQWSLVLSIPAGGGPAKSFEGLDSGHPDLDRWLEEYLRTVSFPASPEGGEYQVRWSLVLASEKPQ